MIYCAAYNDKGKRKHESAFTWEHRLDAIAWCMEYELRGYQVIQWTGRKPPRRYPYRKEAKA